MSQNLNEMMRAWKKSCEKQDDVKLPTRFYEVRKRPSPTRKRVGRFDGITPMGEAMYCAKLGLDKKVARKPKEGI